MYAQHSMFAPKTYGTVNDMASRRTNGGAQRRSMGSVVLCVLWSCFIFGANMALTFFLSGQKFHMVMMLANIFLLFFTLSFAWPSNTNWRNSGALFGWTYFVNWIFVFDALLGFSGWFVGSLIYKDCFQPYNDLKNLNVYPSVEPNLYRGSQLMDAGEIEFVPGSHLQINMSYGFKNDDVYCVAPIVSNSSAMGYYDFWAVGINCCSGHLPDFHCGEYANPGAHKGLRLMRDDQRGYFRLAVEEATAAFNIKAPAPTFFYWMEFPSDEVHSYYSDGVKYSEDACVYYVIVQLVLIILLMMCGNMVKTDTRAGGMADTAYAL